MRGSKAKALRRFVNETCDKMPDVEYTAKKVNTINGVRFIMQLAGTCKRKVYQNLKKETRNMAMV